MLTQTALTTAMSKLTVIKKDLLGELKLAVKDNDLVKLWRSFVMLLMPRSPNKAAGRWLIFQVGMQRTPRNSVV
jgi:hypothetical protein